MENPKFDSQDPIALLKEQWRLYLKEIRQHLSSQRREKGSAEACQYLAGASQKSRFVLSFASFGSEINLWPLNEELCREGRLVLPLVTKKNELQLFQIPHLNLKPHSLGMLEPCPSLCPRIDPSQIAIALIPGIGFDLTNKHRLGYGQGCYDKFLRSKGTIKKWGIGFLEQGVVDLPFNESDVALDEIFLF